MITQITYNGKIISCTASENNGRHTPMVSIMCHKALSWDEEQEIYRLAIKESEKPVVLNRVGWDTISNTGVEEILLKCGFESTKGEPTTDEHRKEDIDIVCSYYLYPCAAQFTLLYHMSKHVLRNIAIQFDLPFGGKREHLIKRIHDYQLDLPFLFKIY